MSRRFPHSLSPLLFFLFFLCSTPLILTQLNVDPTIKTMHDFSGYPLDDPSSPSKSPDSNSNSLSVDALALQKQIDELSTFSDAPAPAVTRILYSENDVLARRYIKNLMGLAGLSVREDVVGNIFCRWDGYEPELTAVATGSHIDAIPYSGKYDGVVGVLGAIEAINALKRSGFKPKRSLEIILFTSEEPTRFGIGCLGSRLLAGDETLAEALKTMVDGKNISFLEAARAAGYARDEGDLSSVFLKKDSYSAFVELHIEQGPILEKEGISIGIVTNIAAPASIKVDFEGNGGHAGGVLMPDRNDAGLAAAELALALEKHVMDSGSINTVGTVGILELHPEAINSIPSKAHLEIDVRDIDEDLRNVVIEKIHNSAKSIAKKRKVALSEFKIINQDPPAQSEKSIIKAMEAASKELNLTRKYMFSRAYHDSLFMARISPMGMVFIPCYKGYSHKPEEYASPQDIENGVKVLALTLAKLSLS
ncbi:ureidoglycolate amidohydrolase, ARABIDOPSIS THALIANA ALLANTOATE AMIDOHYDROLASE 2 [Hibiscus trionum]|uniref:Ureidoglycolate amidohydrolase, ARABIDOPSIS THALIANA ALLANTOATE AMIDOHYDROLASE 2 n=1 Tax=Hibiscus trionum TaxID=183268 RepID=A0A9W7J7J8_HIBTR|nr:ureidoglycolate amidohydrolase, ARABIDOPSIS THALIANA ALLANTOATE AMIDOHYDROLASE 2 [Hibiscus trionum]